MGKNLLKKIGIGFILAGAIGSSGCGTICPEMYLDDRVLGARLSEDLNGKDKPRYVVYDISTSKYNFKNKERK